MRCGQVRVLPQYRVRKLQCIHQQHVAAPARLSRGSCAALLLFVRRTAPPAPEPRAPGGRRRLGRGRHALSEAPCGAVQRRNERVGHELRHGVLDRVLLVGRAPTLPLGGALDLGREPTQRDGRVPERGRRAKLARHRRLLGGVQERVLHAAQRAAERLLTARDEIAQGATERGAVAERVAHRVVVEAQQVVQAHACDAITLQLERLHHAGVQRAAAASEVLVQHLAQQPLVHAACRLRRRVALREEGQLVV